MAGVLRNDAGDDRALELLGLVTNRCKLTLIPAQELVETNAHQLRPYVHCSRPRM